MFVKISDGLQINFLDLSNQKTSATIQGYGGPGLLTRAEMVRFIRNVLSNAKYTTAQPLKK